MTTVAEFWPIQSCFPLGHLLTTQRLIVPHVAGETENAMSNDKETLEEITTRFQRSGMEWVDSASQFEADLAAHFGSGDEKFREWAREQRFARIARGRGATDA